MDQNEPQSNEPANSPIAPPPMKPFSCSPAYFDQSCFVRVLGGPPQPMSSPRLPTTPASDAYTLILDLDETLLHTEMQGTFSNRYLVHERPFVREFLRSLKQLPFEVVIFTAGIQGYADMVINIMDGPTRTIDHRLYRQHTTFAGEQRWKDLSLLNRDLSRSLIVDNTPEVFQIQHPDNGLVISSWEGHLAKTPQGEKTFQTMEDHALLNLFYWLEYLCILNIDVPEFVNQYREPIRVAVGHSNRTPAAKNYIPPFPLGPASTDLYNRCYAYLSSPTSTAASSPALTARIVPPVAKTLNTAPLFQIRPPPLALNSALDFPSGQISARSHGLQTKLDSVDSACNLGVADDHQTQTALPARCEIPPLAKAKVPQVGFPRAHVPFSHLPEIAVGKPKSGGKKLVTRLDLNTHKAQMYRSHHLTGVSTNTDNFQWFKRWLGESKDRAFSLAWSSGEKTAPLNEAEPSLVARTSLPCSSFNSSAKNINIGSRPAPLSFSSSVA